MNINTVYNILSKKYENYNKNENVIHEFKKKFTLEERKKKCADIKKKYPNRIPIICGASPELPKLRNYKFLVNEDACYTNFLFCLRKSMKISKEKAIYLFIGNKLLATSILLKDAYYNYRDEDGFLYTYICSENTFG